MNIIEAIKSIEADTSYVSRIHVICRPGLWAPAFTYEPNGTWGLLTIPNSSRRYIPTITDLKADDWAFVDRDEYINEQRVMHQRAFERQEAMKGANP